MTSWLAFEFSPDGQHLLTASNDGSARLWDVKTGQPVRVFAKHAEALEDAGFSSDGRRIFTASCDATAKLWDVENATVLAVLSGHTGPVLSARFSTDGKQLLTASGDTAQLWDSNSGEVILKLVGHEGPVVSAVFTPDGRHIITASWDRSARLWEATTGKNIAAFVGHNDYLSRVACSPDSGRILTGSNDGTARREPDSGDSWLFPGVYARKVVPRGLDREQREKAGLDPRPPAWYIEMDKWPYHTQDWKTWLRYQKENRNPPLPYTAEWSGWRSTHKRGNAPR